MWKSDGHSQLPHLCSEHGPGVVELAGWSQSGLAEGWLLESSCPKRLQPHEFCGVHHVDGEEWSVESMLEKEKKLPMVL